MIRIRFRLEGKDDDHDSSLGMDEVRLRRSDGSSNHFEFILRLVDEIVF